VVVGVVVLADDLLVVVDDSLLDFDDSLVDFDDVDGVVGEVGGGNIVEGVGDTDVVGGELVDVQRLNWWSQALPGLQQTPLRSLVHVMSFATQGSTQSAIPPEKAQETPMLQQPLPRPPSLTQEVWPGGQMRVFSRMKSGAAVSRGSWSWPPRRRYWALRRGRKGMVRRKT